MIPHFELAVVELLERIAKALEAQNEAVNEIMETPIFKELFLS